MWPIFADKNLHWQPVGKVEMDTRITRIERIYTDFVRVTIWLEALSFLRQTQDKF
jgi:hypothetical protein